MVSTYEQRKKLGIQKPCGTKLEIPKLDHKNDHENLQKPCGTKQKHIKSI